MKSELEPRGLFRNESLETTCFPAGAAHAPVVRGQSGLHRAPRIQRRLIDAQRLEQQRSQADAFVAAERRSTIFNLHQFRAEDSSFVTPRDEISETKQASSTFCRGFSLERCVQQPGNLESMDAAPPRTPALPAFTSLARSPASVASVVPFGRPATGSRESRRTFAPETQEAVDGRPDDAVYQSQRSTKPERGLSRRQSPGRLRLRDRKSGTGSLKRHVKADDVRVVIRLSSWMGDQRIRTLRFWDVCFPGTHNSASWCLAGDRRARWSSVVFAFLKLYIHCQAVTVFQQLQLGVRFLDLRVCKNLSKNGDPYCAHGGFRTVAFKEVLTQMNDFLELHPTEIIILSVRRDVAYLSGPGMLGTVEADFWVAACLKRWLGPQLEASVTIGELADRHHNVIYFFEERERYLLPVGSKAKHERPSAEGTSEELLPVQGSPRAGNISPRLFHASPLQPALDAYQGWKETHGRRGRLLQSGIGSTPADVQAQPAPSLPELQDLCLGSPVRAPYDRDDALHDKPRATQADFKPSRSVLATLGSRVTKGHNIQASGGSQLPVTSQPASLAQEPPPSPLAEDEEQEFRPERQLTLWIQKHVPKFFVSRLESMPEPMFLDAFGQPKAMLDETIIAKWKEWFAEPTREEKPDSKTGGLKAAGGNLGGIVASATEQALSSRVRQAINDRFKMRKPKRRRSVPKARVSFRRHVLSEAATAQIDGTFKATDFLWIRRADSLPFVPGLSAQVRATEVALTRRHRRSVHQARASVQGTAGGVASAHVTPERTRKAARPQKLVSVDTADSQPSTPGNRDRIRVEPVESNLDAGLGKDEAKTMDTRGRASVSRHRRFKGKPKGKPSDKGHGAQTEQTVMDERRSGFADSSLVRPDHPEFPFAVRSGGAPARKSLDAFLQAMNAAHKDPDVVLASTEGQDEGYYSDRSGITALPAAKAMEDLLSHQGGAAPTSALKRAAAGKAEMGGAQMCTLADLSTEADGSALSSSRLPPSYSHPNLDFLLAKAVSQVQTEGENAFAVDGLLDTRLEEAGLSRIRRSRSWCIPCGMEADFSESFRRRATISVDRTCFEKVDLHEALLSETRLAKSGGLARGRRRRARQPLKRLAGDAQRVKNEQDTALWAPLGMIQAAPSKGENWQPVVRAPSRKITVAGRETSATFQNLRDTKASFDVVTPFLVGKTKIIKSWSATCDPNPRLLCEKLAYWITNQGEPRPRQPHVIRVVAGEVTPPSFGSPDSSMRVVKFWTVQGAAALVLRNGGLKVAAKETHKLLLANILRRSHTDRVNGVTHDFVSEEVVSRIVKHNLVAAAGTEELRRLKRAQAQAP